MDATSLGFEVVLRVYRSGCSSKVGGRATGHPFKLR